MSSTNVPFAANSTTLGHKRNHSSSGSEQILDEHILDTVGTEQNQSVPTLQVQPHPQEPRPSHPNANEKPPKKKLKEDDDYPTDLQYESDDDECMTEFEDDPDLQLYPDWARYESGDRNEDWGDEDSEDEDSEDEDSEDEDSEDEDSEDENSEDEDSEDEDLEDEDSEDEDSEEEVSEEAVSALEVDECNVFAGGDNPASWPPHSDAKFHLNLNSKSRKSKSGTSKNVASYTASPMDWNATTSSSSDNGYEADTSLSDIKSGAAPTPRGDHDTESDSGLLLPLSSTADPAFTENSKLPRLSSFTRPSPGRGTSPKRSSESDLPVLQKGSLSPSRNGSSDSELSPPPSSFGDREPKS
ncbi:hypothetical protein BJ508DRAFT_315737, partial [Ascobolus immersus RN42]